ncbi:hypothetical protein BG004_003952, partial [Podila humilis]
MDYLQTSHPHGNHSRSIDRGNPASHPAVVMSKSSQLAETEPKGTTQKTSTNGQKAKSGSEQGRNSTKRAAQNRAAQRAFRQRKDQYVRELERKASLLPAAENKVAALTARVEQLEAALAAAEAESGRPISTPATFPPRLQIMDSPSGLVEANLGATTPSSSHIDRDREWDWESEKWKRDKPPQELNGSTVHDGSSASSAGRRIIPRHSSSHQLRQAYHSPPSPTFANVPVKQVQQYPYYPDHDPHETSHRRLRRHPSESSLNLRMKEQAMLGPANGSFPGYRSNSLVETGMDMSSPPSIHNDGQFNPPGPPRHPTLPVPSGRQQEHTGSRPYPSSPLTPSRERSPLYSIPQSQVSMGVRSGSSTSPNASHPQHRLHTEEMNGGATTPSATISDMSKKRPSDGAAGWGGQDLYRNPEDSANAHSYHQVKKQSSWTSLSDQYRNQTSIRKQQSLGSLSDRRLLQQQHSTAVRDIQYFRDNNRTASSPGSALSPINSSFNFSPKIHHSGSSSVTLPPVSALSLASPSSRPREIIDDDVGELSPIPGGERHFHHHYHHRPMLHHRASTNSLRATKSSPRRPSWPEAGFESGPESSGATDGGQWNKIMFSPETPISDSRFASPTLPSLPRMLPPYSQKPPLPTTPMNSG